MFFLYKKEIIINVTSGLDSSSLHYTLFRVVPFFFNTTFIIRVCLFDIDHCEKIYS